MTIPIIIICYNNYKYVKNTVEQLTKINKDFSKNIIILDNKSTCDKTINYLKSCNVKVMYNNSNEGPWINEYKNIELYNSLPDKFIVTDPDLQFNPNLPTNFIDILVELSDKYSCYKIGFGLDISDYDKMYDYIYTTDSNQTIYEWEQNFWKDKIDNNDYELYWAAIDTTFALVNKKINKQNSIRICSNFTAKHIPWYTDNPIYNIYEIYNFCNKTTNISTTSKVIKKHLADNYSKIDKNNEYFFIKNDSSDPNYNFWTQIYSNWEKETFEVFDKYLKDDKIFIDIGAWIGTTCIYGARKSSHVYTIDADKESIEYLSKNCKINCNNYTIINRAIYNIDDIDMKFGKNLFRNESTLNDSTSHIYLENEISDNYYTIQTISIKGILEKYKIDINNVSLIKVDIEGGEEHILNDLYEIFSLYKVPIYVSFHYSWWKNLDLNRFSFLTEEQKYIIRYNPFVSLLFNQK